MALFKIFEGNSVNLPARTNNTIGYCYVTLDEHKMYIDASNQRFALNAVKADYTGKIVNSINFANLTPSDIHALFDDNKGGIIYGYMPSESFMASAPDDGIYYYPCEAKLVGEVLKAYEEITLFEVERGLIKYYRYQVANGWSKWNQVTNSLEPTGDVDTPIYIDQNGNAQSCTSFLPLTAGETHKLAGPLGLPSGIMYGESLPETGFEGQLFFLAEDAENLPLYVPEGGSTGHVLIKNSAVSGDYEWKELVALPKGGSTGQVLVKNSTTDGDASWRQADYLPLTGGTITGGLILDSQNYVDPVGQNFALGIQGSDSAVSGIAILNSTQGITLYLTPDGYAGLADLNGNPLVYKSPQGNYHLGPSGVYSNGTVLYGAAWNDYAEYRSQKELIEPGYCVASSNNGQVYKTTEKFQACDGIVSDTFGFAIGETEECKTPLAVAGRVLAYCEGNRQDYHSGDTVCAGPNGKVCKMTREEICEWPDRIIGIVSEIPEYETWGDGDVPVNGRIWIKVK